MEKNSAEILREMEEALASLKERVRSLEGQMAEYQKLAAEEAAAVVEDPIPEEVDFTDMEIGVTDLPEETVPAPEPEDLPEPEPVPVEKPVPVSAPKADTERLPWRLDKPGVSVKNIRSGISLYDRALFIGTLFKEDYALYDKTIGTLNAMSTLDEAVDYLVEAFPDWNLKSDIVYNFMMAIRKKLG